MRLAELEPEFLRWEDRFEGVPNIKPVGGEFGDPYQHTVVPKVATLAEAQGIGFLCPGCFTRNGGAAGTHMVQVGFHGRGLLPHQSSQAKQGGPSRWHVVSGQGVQDLTLAPSIDCGCWHGYIKLGEAVDA